MLPNDIKSRERMLQIASESLAKGEYDKRPEVIENAARTLSGYPSNGMPNYFEDMLLLEVKYREKLEDPGHYIHNLEYLYEPSDGKDGSLFKVTDLEHPYVRGRD